MEKINNNIANFYCSFEESMLLKKAGFDVPCLAVYYPSGQLSPYSKSGGIKNSHKKNQQWECTTPTKQMALQWIQINFEMEAFVLPINPALQTPSNMAKYALWIYSPNINKMSSSPPHNNSII
jgi:hypothetical protein